MTTEANGPAPTRRLQLSADVVKRLGPDERVREAYERWMDETFNVKAGYHSPSAVDIFRSGWEAALGWGGNPPTSAQEDEPDD